MTDTVAERMIDVAKDLADAHWKFVKECLTKHADIDQTFTFEELLDDAEWAFKHGFVHGFKHGNEG